MCVDSFKVCTMRCVATDPALLAYYLWKKVRICWVLLTSSALSVSFWWQFKLLLCGWSAGIKGKRIHQTMTPITLMNPIYTLVYSQCVFLFQFFSRLINGFCSDCKEFLYCPLFAYYILYKKIALPLELRFSNKAIQRVSICNLFLFICFFLSFFDFYI